MNFGHAVEVVIGDNYVLCIAGNIDHLKEEMTPTPSITTQHTRQ